MGGRKPKTNQNNKLKTEQQRIAEKDLSKKDLKNRTNYSSTELEPHKNLIKTRCYG